MEASLAKNRKAYHDYEVVDSLEGGIELAGDEVKSIKNSQTNLKGSYVEILNGEAFIKELQISKYKQSSNYSYDPKRKRKILLHKKEIEKLDLELQTKGQTLIPLELYLKKGRIKIKIGLCKGKKLFDKRTDLKKKAQSLDIARAIKKYS